MNPLRGLFSVLAGQVGQQVVAVDVDLEGLVADLVSPFSSFSLMSGSPAAARKVGSQSWCWTISFETDARPGSCPASGSCTGTRKAPSQLVFFSLRNGVIAAIRPGVHVRPVVGAST